LGGAGAVSGRQDERPLITFFVAAYNQELTVRAAVESAFAQTWQPLEILLSDDASSDRTFAVMQEMAAGYAGPHRIRLNRNPRNLGIPGHIDRIMQLAEGAFVVQNAGDDVSAPERTERLADVWLSSGGRAKAVHSAKLRIDATGKVQGRLPEREPLDRHPPLRLLQRPPDIYGAAMGWSREVFEVFGPLGPKPLLEDYPICLRAATLGEVVYLDEPLLGYRVGGLSARAPESIGFYALYGYRLKLLRWHLSFARLYLDDMARAAPPEAAACRAQAERNIRDFGFELALAGMGRAARLRALPAAVGTSLRYRDAAPLRKNLKYLLDGPYMKWLDRRARSRGARRAAPEVASGDG
jgi:glycosyltransferase involved in cell wall biosynthesis